MTNVVVEIQSNKLTELINAICSAAKARTSTIPADKFVQKVTETGVEALGRIIDLEINQIGGGWQMAMSEYSKLNVLITLSAQHTIFVEFFGDDLDIHRSVFLYNVVQTLWANILQTNLQPAELAAS